MTNIAPGEKVAPVVDSAGVHQGWVVFCPACENAHMFDPRWTFNGDKLAPTFTPSMLVHAVPGYRGRCHSFMTSGVWNYCSDSEHGMAGKQVAAPEFRW